MKRRFSDEQIVRILGEATVDGVPDLPDGPLGLELSGPASLPGRGHACLVLRLCP